MSSTFISKPINSPAARGWPQLIRHRKHIVEYD
jgi:hypothetical protein